MEANDDAGQRARVPAPPDGLAADRDADRPSFPGNEQLDVAWQPCQVDARAVGRQVAGSAGMGQLVDAPPRARRSAEVERDHRARPRIERELGQRRRARERLPTLDRHTAVQVDPPARRQVHGGRRPRAGHGRGEQVGADEELVGRCPRPGVCGVAVAERAEHRLACLEEPVEVGEELVVEDCGVVKPVHRGLTESPRRRVRARAADLHHRRDGPELGPAHEELCVVGGRRGVAADVGAPGREAAHRGGLPGDDRPLEADVLLGLVARPHPRHDCLRADGAGAEDRGGPGR